MAQITHRPDQGNAVQYLCECGELLILQHEDESEQIKKLIKCFKCQNNFKFTEDE